MQTENQNEANAYLRDLLNKHPQAKKIGQSLQDPIAKYQQQICNGRYNIQQHNEANPEKPEPKPETMSTEEHELFMRKLREEKDKVRSMKRQRINLEKEKEKHEKEEAIRREEEEKRDKEFHKKKQLEERLNSMNMSRQRRSSEAEASHKALIMLKKSETLHQKLLANFLHNEASSLEDKKKKLAEIRDLHKPLTKYEFEQHNQKIQKLRQKVSEQRSHMRNKRSASVSNIYKSVWYQKASEIDPAQQLTEKQQQQVKKAKQMRQKLKKYGDYVKSNFKPEIDSKKAEQLKEMIASTSHHALDLKGDQGRVIGLQYLKYSKEHIAPTRSVNQNKTNTNITTSSNLQKPINYLDEMKKQRKAAEQKIGSPVDSILKQPIEEKQKVQLVMSQVQKMEEQAKRKEKLSKLNQKVVDQELDALYVNTIKAKLALLK